MSEVYKYAAATDVCGKQATAVIQHSNHVYEHWKYSDSHGTIMNLLKILTNKVCRIFNKFMRRILTLYIDCKAKSINELA